MQLFTDRYRHIRRYRQIINVVSKHGLGHILDLIGLKTPVFLSRLKKSTAQPNTALRVKMVLEELGPTFIKMGQLLSMRPDLLPPEYLTQLEKLQERVAPVDFEQIKAVIEKELKQPLSAIFAEIDPKPVAAASIGQAHSARLVTGEAVIVKVQRPGVRKLIKVDLEILEDIAHFLEARTEWGHVYHITGLIEEFTRTIRDETDYTIEASNAERFAGNFQDDPTVRFPKVFWKFSTKQVLVLEAISGIKIYDFTGLKDKKIDKDIVCQNLVNSLLKQLIRDGFFHADPHPGNILIADDGAIIFLDFGMVGRLNAWIRERLSFLLLNLIQENTANIVDIIVEIGEIRGNINRKAIGDEIFYLFDKYYHRPLNRIPIGLALQELLGLALKYRFKFPRELSLVARCLFLLESNVSRLSSDRSLLELSRPFGSKLLREQFGWRNLSKIGTVSLQDWLFFSLDLPVHLKKIMHMAESGETKLILEHQNFDSFIARMSLIGNRLSFSLIIAAIIVGSSLIAQQTKLTLFGSFPIAEAGFIAAVLMGIWLIISIIRSGKI